MIIDSDKSSFFFAVYKKILSAYSESETDFQAQQFVAVRDELYSDSICLKELVEANLHMPKNVLSLFKSISMAKFGEYVYLRTLKKYAIFISLESHEVYCVLGLTNNFDNLIPYKYAIVKTALIDYHNIIVCDGLISTTQMKLGTNLRKKYEAIYRQAKIEKKLISTLPGGY